MRQIDPTLAASLAREIQAAKREMIRIVGSANPKAGLSREDKLVEIAASSAHGRAQEAADVLRRYREPLNSLWTEMA